MDLQILSNVAIVVTQQEQLKIILQDKFLSVTHVKSTAHFTSNNSLLSLNCLQLYFFDN